MNAGKIAQPFARPLYVMLKPAASACNLRCRYCYYLDKRHLSPQGPQPMSYATLEEFTRQYIEAQTSDEILFTWHGGEPTLRPLEFYRRAMSLQRRYGQGRRISNALQTNGTLLNDEWCEFLSENGWLTGLSIDGPADLTDPMRRSAEGEATWERAMRGISLLKKHGCEWNAMATVNTANAKHPREFYDFFRSIGCRYLQFSPVVERTARRPDGLALAAPDDDPAICELADFSVSPDDWGEFLCGVFDEWVRSDVGEVFVEMFDCILANYVGVTPGICIFARDCGHAGVMEADGSVYSCDHYVFPEYRLGDIRRATLTEMLYGPQQTAFSRLKHGSLPRQCRECRFEFACHGECPRNRFCRDRYGNPGLNYLCRGYRRFFEHSAPYFAFMRDEYLAGRAPANVMQAKLGI